MAEEIIEMFELFAFLTNKLMDVLRDFFPEEKGIVVL